MLRVYTERDAEFHGAIAHTVDNLTRRYFEPHLNATPQRRVFRARGGETRTLDELIDPRVWEPGCEVRP